jgi:HK97 family phage major capsid protein
MSKTAEQSRKELLACAEQFLKNHEDEHGLLSAEDQAVVDAMLAGAETMRSGPLLTQAELDRHPLPMPKGHQGHGIQFIDSEGRHVRAIGREESVSRDGPVGDGGPSIGHVARAMVTGDWGSLEHTEYAAMIGGSGEAGGYLLNPRLSEIFVDLARSASVLMKAGAQTVPMGSESSLVIARLTQDPTAYWRHEAAVIQGSAAKFGTIMLAPKTVAALVPISVELAEDSKNAAAEIERAMSAAIGLAIDQAGLLGVTDGIGAWIGGIFNEASINSVTAVGSPDSYAGVTSAISKILQADYQGELTDLAWLAHPRDWETYDGLVDGDGQPIAPTPWASKPRRLSTTSLPTTLGVGENESQMLIGDFSEVLMATKTRGIVLQVFDQGSATDEAGNTVHGVAQMLKWIRAYARVDFAVLRPTWFTKLTGVTAVGG